MPLYEHQLVRPTIDSSVFIAPNATVIGDVVIGEGSSVWFGTVVRGDVFPIRIGLRTNIQDNSVVHVTGGKAGTTIGDDVTVGHMALLHGCTVGDRVLIGMGSIVLDGAEIGSDSIVAAGSLVAPRTKVPKGSMVMGRPAKVVRALTAADFEMVAEAGRLYVQYAQTFQSAEVREIERAI